MSLPWGESGWSQISVPITNGLQHHQWRRRGLAERWICYWKLYRTIGQLTSVAGLGIDQSQLPSGTINRSSQVRGASRRTWQSGYSSAATNDPCQLWLKLFCIWELLPKSIAHIPVPVPTSSVWRGFWIGAKNSLSLKQRLKIWCWRSGSCQWMQQLLPFTLLPSLSLSR